MQHRSGLLTEKSTIRMDTNDKNPLRITDADHDFNESYRNHHHYRPSRGAGLPPVIEMIGGFFVVAMAIYGWCKLLGM